MSLKKYYLLALFILILPVTRAEVPAVSYKLYGFVRNELYINSRQNFEALDGTFNIFPNPTDFEYSIDKNATPNSQMLAISSRLGFDFTGTTVFGANTSAKIECDFAGVKAYYYLIRLRQAYFKLNWEKTELLVGQTWHPMFINLQPVTPALSVGTPFQPFNRSPQIRISHKLGENISILSAASYQMQYLTQGPLGPSASYMKNGLLPGLYIDLKYKSNNFLAGLGMDGKSILVNHERLNSVSAFVYAQYAQKKFQVRSKTILGQNLSELLMIGGYGVSGVKHINENTLVNTYTNFNTLTSWLSFAYGTKIQASLYGGISKNLGTNKELLLSSGEFTAYGYGFYQSNQILLDQLYRIAPGLCYNVSNFKLGVEYELTIARYGSLLKNGLTTNNYRVDNHRLLATVSYLF